MRAVSFGARWSISLSSGIRMTASVYLALIYKSFVSFSTEAKRNRMLSSFQRTNSRPTAVSLIHSLWLGILDYARQRNTDFNETPRVYLSRANILMPLLRLMRCRATELFKWAMMKFIAKLNSTASRNSQRGGVWTSLRSLRKERPPRRSLK